MKKLLKKALIEKSLKAANPLFFSIDDMSEDFEKFTNKEFNRGINIEHLKQHRTHLPPLHLPEKILE